jgi:hypothetical protein
MSRRGITADEYQELLDTADFSPVIRGELERLKRKRNERDEFLARLGEKRRREMVIEAWQRDSLREFHKLLALQFEARAWENRESKPLWSAEATNMIIGKKRGMQQRLAKAHREAADGCRLHIEWLAKHAELIEALEQS